MMQSTLGTWEEQHVYKHVFIYVLTCLESAKYIYHIYIFIHISAAELIIHLTKMY